jgi:ketosteroid isomerase-like protein/uncharacterized membrane protein YphA (DoxX/SURF4 family)
MWTTLTELMRRHVTIYLRVALAAGFLSAVSDRFGLWGLPGGTNVAWGSFQRFTAYTGQLNPWAPAVLIPPLAWFVTVVETVLGIALILGLRTRYAALASGVLLALFALGMTVGASFKSALSYSVFAASAAAFALATADAYRWSLDALLTSRAQRRGVAPGESALRAQRAPHHPPGSVPGRVDRPGHERPRAWRQNERSLTGGPGRTEMYQENVKVILDVFSAIEHRDPQRPDLQRLLDLFHPDVEFHWPPSLPYGGTLRGLKSGGPTWADTWDALQPTEAERRMDARVVAASEQEVVVLWRQRGVSRTGERFDGQVLGLYEIRDRKLARAQMFYFDTTALLEFLTTAKSQAA